MWRDQDGTSPLAAVFSVAIFLTFLLLATQVLVHLYTTSMLTSVAFDAARKVAGADALRPAVAETEARDRLGRYGQRPELRFDWSASTGDVVVLRVRGPTPATLIAGVGRLAQLDRIEREVRVRVERLR